jgi:hypothetical protein
MPQRNLVGSYKLPLFALAIDQQHPSDLAPIQCIGQPGVIEGLPGSAPA